MSTIYLEPGEVIAIAGFVGALFTVWINTKVRIAKIETLTRVELNRIESTTNLKIAGIEARISDYIKSNADTMAAFILDNKEDHKEIAQDVKGIKKSLECVNIALAKFTP